jgi:hypothetical protein
MLQEFESLRDVSIRSARIRAIFFDKEFYPPRYVVGKNNWYADTANVERQAAVNECQQSPVAHAST